MKHVSKFYYFKKAEVNETLSQELLIQLWDYDGYFPGVQGDDPLGELVQKKSHA